MLLLLITLLLTVTASAAQQQSSLHLRVVDNARQPVAAARVEVRSAEPGAQGVTLRAATSGSGELFLPLPPGRFLVRVEKKGFHAVDSAAVLREGATELEIVLTAAEAVQQVVDVLAQAEVQRGAARADQLTADEVEKLAYPRSGDLRNALALLPGVLPAPHGQLHLAGSDARDVSEQMDGFQVTDPAAEPVPMRLSVDALRSAQVLTSRYPAEFGKGSGGAVGLQTFSGEDRTRFAVTNFFPSVQFVRGVQVHTWLPRLLLSGPLARNRIWVGQALEADYALNIVPELPAGADRNPVLRASSLSKAQFNLGDRQVLTATALVNYGSSRHAGLSPTNPLEQTIDERRRAGLLALKHHAELGDALLLEAGVSAMEFHTRHTPAQSLPHAGGHVFKRRQIEGRRAQGILNLHLPPQQWGGRHELRLGLEGSRLARDAAVERTIAEQRRPDGTLYRRTAFEGPEVYARQHHEAGAFLQDRWAPREGLLVETGVRLDWDAVLGQALSPRLAASLLAAGTRFSAGIGIYRDAADLERLSRPFAGSRLDEFYQADGETLEGPPAITRFLADEPMLRHSRILNWSVGAERLLPGRVIARLEFLQKRGAHGLAFYPVTDPELVGGTYELRSARNDRFHSLQLTATRPASERATVLAAYTWSRATSDAVLDFSLEQPVFGRQAAGAQPWDVPHRFLFWGWTPLPRRLGFAWSVEARSGYPFSVVDSEQRLVGDPNSWRFPAYFSLNLHLEREFRLWGYRWALRGGVNNVTDRDNPWSVNNNIDSPDFLRFSWLQRRALAARVRLLGRAR